MELLDRLPKSKQLCSKWHIGNSLVTHIPFFSKPYSIFGFLCMLHKKWLEISTWWAWENDIKLDDGFEPSPNVYSFMVFSQLLSVPHNPVIYICFPFCTERLHDVNTSLIFHNRNLICCNLFMIYMVYV